HLEVLMNGVAREGVEWHVRAGHLEGPRWQVIDIGDADIGSERDVQSRAACAEEEFVRWRQARIDQAEVRRHRANATQIRRRQRSVELLLCHIGTNEEFAAIRRRHDLELLCLAEIWAGRTVPIDNALREKV